MNKIYIIDDNYQEEVILNFKNDTFDIENTSYKFEIISKDKLLIQTATIAEPIKYTFANGKTEYVPYTFVELVQRRREGFEQENAKRIFTSTQ
jgi:hypothetical protein